MKRLLLLCILFVSLLPLLQAQSLEPKRIKVVTGDEEGTYFQMMQDLNMLADSIVKVDSIVGYRFEIVQVPQYIDTIYSRANPDSDFDMPQIERVKKVNPNTNEVITKDSIIPAVDRDTSMLAYIDIRPSGGDYINYQKLVSNDYRYADVYFLQYDVLMYEELRQIKGNVDISNNVRVLLPIGDAEIHLITRMDSEIDSLPDLEKKRVGVGIQGTGITAEIIRERLGIKWQRVNVGLSNAMGQLLNKQIDAFFYVGMAPEYRLQNTSPLLKNLIRLVPVKSDSLTGIYRETTIPVGTYEWQDSTVSTYKVKILLATNIGNESQMDYRRIDGFLDFIRTRLDTLKTFNYFSEYQYHPKWAEVDTTLEINQLRRTVRFPGIEWKVHRAAIKQFMKRPTAQGGGQR